MATKITTLELTPQGVQLCRDWLTTLLLSEQAVAIAAARAVQYNATGQMVANCAGREVKILNLLNKLDGVEVELNSGQCDLLNEAFDKWYYISWSKALRRVSDLTNRDNKTHTRDVVGLQAMLAACEPILNQLLNRKEDEDEPETV